MKEDDKTKNVTDKLSKVTIKNKLKKLDLNEVEMDFVATLLNSSALCDKTAVCPKLESEIAFKSHLNDDDAEAFNNQIFKQDGNERAILNTKFYNPHDLILQHISIKDKVNIIEGNGMRNGYNIHFMPNVGIQKLFKLEEK